MVADKVIFTRNKKRNGNDKGRPETKEVKMLVDCFYLNLSSCYLQYSY